MSFLSVPSRRKSASTPTTTSEWRALVSGEALGVSRKFCREQSNNSFLLWGVNPKYWRGNVVCSRTCVCKRQKAQEHLYATQPSLTVTSPSNDPFRKRQVWSHWLQGSLSCSTVASWDGTEVKPSSCRKSKELEPHCPLW